MKKVFLLFTVAIMLIASCGKERKFEVSGTIKGITQAMNADQVRIFLKGVDADDKLVTIDSVLIDSTGVFKMKGKSSESEVFYLADEEGSPILPFFVDPGDKIVIEGDVNNWENVSIKGSKSQLIYEEYIKNGMAVKNEQQQLYNEYIQAMQTIKDSIQQAEIIADIEHRWELLVNKASDEVKEFIKNNNKSVVSAYLISFEMRTVDDVNKLDSLVKLLDPSLAQSKFVKNVNDRIAVLRVSEIGATLPDINLPDTANVNVSTNAIVGQYKYMLIDFWAGWCRPCMEEMPYLVKAFDAYKDKGFMIYGVSLDRDRSTWVGAINRFNMGWINVSDLKYWDCPYVKTFGIQGIPMNILVDSKGVVVAKNLRGKDIDTKLAELFGTSIAATN